MLNDHAFQFLREAVERLAGVHIEPAQLPMVEARLTTLARGLGYPKTEELVARVQRPDANGLLTQTVEALLNNETSFFRDLPFYQALEDRVLPELIRRRSRIKTLNIWSAACSTGQEPYSLLMLLMSRFPALFDDWSIYLLATDLSRTNLEVAREGRYRQFQINRGLPAQMLLRFFDQEGDHWRIHEALRRRIEFTRVNLLEDWPVLPTFDLILLRNVLLYFDDDRRARVLGRAEGQLREHGLLSLGGGEIFTGTDRLESVHHGRWIFFGRPSPSETWPALPAIVWPKGDDER